MPNKSSIDLYSRLAKPHEPDGLIVPLDLYEQTEHKKGFALDNWQACPLHSKEREDPRKTEALIRAVVSGDVATARALLDSGARVWHRDANGAPPLHFAAYCNQVEVARLLLQRRADPNATKDNSAHATKDNAMYATALHVAATNGHKGLVQLLKEFGANTLAKDALSRTPCQAAQLRGHSEVVKLLQAPAQAENHILATHGRTLVEETRRAFFELRDNAVIFESAGIGKLNDPGLLVVFMDTLNTEIFDTHGLAKAFDFGSWSSPGTRILNDGLAQLAAAVAKGASKYTRLLLVVPAGHEQWPHDEWTRSLELLADAEAKGSPVWQLNKALQHVLPRTELFVYNSCIDTLTGKPIFPELQRSIPKLQAEGARQSLFENYDNAVIFEEAGLGHLKDPKWLLIFMDDFSTEILDANGLAEPFRFGNLSVGGKQPGSERLFHEELARLGSLVATRPSAYTLVLLIGPIGRVEWPLDAWMVTLKSLADAEPEGSLLRGLRVTLKGAVPKARLRVYNTCTDSDTGQPIFPQLQR